MSLKAKIYLIIFIIVCIAISILNYCIAYKQKREAAQLETNIKAGYESGFKIVNYYKAKNGQLVAKNAVLQYTAAQLKNNISDEISALLKNLSIKPARVNLVSTNVLETEKHIITTLKDTIIFDTVKISCFNYSDRFYNINGYSYNGKEFIKIHSTDSITQVIYKGDRYNKRGKKRPQLFFWCPRRLEQVITTANPDNKIIYSKTVFINR